MSYPSLAPNRSSFDVRRRRRRIVVLAIVVAVVGLVALAVRYRTEERQATDYMAVAADIAQDQAGVADSLTQMFADLGALERQDLLDQIDVLGAQVSTDVQMLSDQTVPAAVAESHGFLTVALGSWQAAITSLDDAVLLILDGPEDERAGDDALRQTFQQLRVGDQAFVGFLEASSRIEGDVTVGSIAEVVYIPPERENLFDSDTIANRLRATLKLGGLHDISVTARTEPAPLGESNGRPVVPASETFAVQAVVTNVGNLFEEGILVTLELGPAIGNTPAVTREQLILTLDAGEATTVTFEELDLTPGELYNLRVTASIGRDADPSNNVFELTFFRNQDA